MQSLIHGNFTGPPRSGPTRWWRSAAIAAAVGPLLGGFLTTYLSWRVGFGLEVVIIFVVLSQIRLVKDVPYTGPRQIDFMGAVLSVVGMGGIVLGILVWQEGGGYVGLLLGIGAVAPRRPRLLAGSAQAARQAHPIGSDLFKHLNFRIGVPTRLFQQITLGGAMIAPPAFLADDARVQRYEDRPHPAPLSLSMFAIALDLPDARRASGVQRTLRRVGLPVNSRHGRPSSPLVPRVDSGGWYLVAPLVVTGAGLGPALFPSSTTSPWPRSARSGSARPQATSCLVDRSGCLSDRPWQAASCCGPWP